MFRKWAWSGSREQFLHSENFATASRRYTGDIHNSAVVGLFITPIRHYLITSICSGLVVQVLCALAWATGKISTDTTHRAVPLAIAELPV